MLYTKRDQRQQSLHDRVIAQVAPWFGRPEGFEVITNPDGLKNAGIGTPPVFPDLVALGQHGFGRVAVRIGEVETASTVNRNEVQQWRHYSDTGLPFFLFVPAGYAGECLQLAQGEGIFLSGICLYHDQGFTISFEWVP